MKHLNIFVTIVSAFIFLAISVFIGSLVVKKITITKITPTVKNASISADMDLKSSSKSATASPSANFKK